MLVSELSSGTNYLAVEQWGQGLLQTKKGNNAKMTTLDGINFYGKIFNSAFPTNNYIVVL